MTLTLHSLINSLQHRNAPLPQLKHKLPLHTRLHYLLRPPHHIRSTHLIHRIRTTRSRQHCKLRTVPSFCAWKAERDGHGGRGGGVVDGGFPDVRGPHGAGDVEERVEGAVVRAVGEGGRGGGDGEGGGEFVVGEELGMGMGLASG